MSTLGSNLLTLADWAKMLGPDGRMSKIIMMLAQKTGIQQVLPFMEGNLPTGHRAVVQTTLPSVTWRSLNGFVSGSKGVTAQTDFQCGNLEGFLEVDKALAKLNGDSNAFRAQQLEMFMEAIRQELSQTAIYGNEGANPEEFTGLAQYYNSTTGVSAENLISAGGSGSDNSSIYRVQFSGDGIYGIVPKGSMAGIEHNDLKEQLIQNATGAGTGRMVALVDQLIMQAGLVVADWRQGARICNIDISNLVAESSNADLIKLMIKADHAIFDPQKGKGYWFMNRTCFQFLDIQAYAGVKAGGGITYENVDGRRVPMFRNVPVVVDDQLLETEATVS